MKERIIDGLVGCLITLMALAGSIMLLILREPFEEDDELY